MKTKLGIGPGIGIALAMALCGCATTPMSGPVDVMRFHLGEPLERGTLMGAAAPCRSARANRAK